MKPHLFNDTGRTIFATDSIHESKGTSMHTRTIQPSWMDFLTGFVLGGVAIAAIIIMLSIRRMLQTSRPTSTFEPSAEKFPTHPDGDVEEMVEHNWQGF